MNEKKATTIEFIKNNKSFYDAIISLKYPILNIYIILELAILYFHLNNENIKYLSPESQNIINNLLNNNYYVNDNKIIINNQVILLEQIITEIKKIKRLQSEIEKSKIVNISFGESHCQKNSTIPKNPKVISLKDYLGPFEYSMEERSIIFEATHQVDNETYPFVKYNHNEKKKMLNEAIEELIINQSNNLSFLQLTILYAYLSLYPILEYNKSEYMQYICTLVLPQNKIGLSKATFNNPEIKEILDRIINIKNELKHLKIKLDFVKENSSNQIKINFLINQIEAKKLQIENAIVEFYLTSRSSIIYNPNLLENILKSFYQANFTINCHYSDFVIKFYYINNKITEFFCAIHISDLINIVDYDMLLNPNQTKKKIKAEVKNE